MDSWAWNSRSLYFTSSRNNRYSGYEVALWWYSKLCFEKFLIRVAKFAIHQTEKYFNESWEAKFLRIANAIGRPIIPI